jgi:hypothetical protein
MTWLPNSYILTCTLFDGFLVFMHTGDHVLLDSRCFASFPADPKLVTVRTSAAGDRESRDSKPAPLSHQMLEEIRTGMLLTEVELNTGVSGAGSRNASDSVSVFSSLNCLLVKPYFWTYIALDSMTKCMNFWLPSLEQQCAILCCTCVSPAVCWSVLPSVTPCQ